jgi:2-C-methyl-D-erythritol 4-phosphate cytidylyltransferase
MRVIVIIPAAGLGTRMAGASTGTKSGAAPKTAPSKQFIELAGQPIIIHTLRKFASHPRVNEIYLALRKSEGENFRQRLEGQQFGKPVHIVEGGEHRQDSVCNAVKALNANDDDIVLVHDAVRPFVDAAIISNVIDAAAKHGAAIAGVPAVDTIKQVERTAEGAVITTTVPRERAVLAQTPQGFRFALLKRAFDEATADGFTGTDEASLLERSGEEVHVVMGSTRNIKITAPGDMELAELYIRDEKPTAADQHR